MAHLTGLKKSQIANWLANARRRGKVPLTSEETGSHPGAIEIPSVRTGDNTDLQGMNPMERWKVSPPEHEPADLTDIAKAVTANPFLSGHNSSTSSLNRSRQSSSQHHTSSNDDSNLSMFQAPSISSMGTGQSALSSASSLQSGTSRSSMKSRERKDRRRRRRVPPNRLAETPQKLNRIFQCTFCTDAFTSKYDWTRHEKSLHLALDRWICAPSGGIEVIDGVHYCAFCDVIDPDVDHLETHNYSACEEKTIQGRTFYRKDHLGQHLKLLHGCGYHPRMDNWKSQVTEIKSRCGFCPAVFTTWQQRADHLAAHFRNGCDIGAWEGPWGFEPHIERLVENGMPPYVIGNDRLSMNPFVAVRYSTVSSGKDNGSKDPDVPSTAIGATPSSVTSEHQFVSDSNCWRRCEIALSRYIREELQAGRTPTDAQLQSKGRTLIYGDDDPWNQAPADNKQWLTLLKKQNGLDNGENTDVEVSKQANGQRVTRLEELPINPPYCVRGGRKRPTSGTPHPSRPNSMSGSRRPEISSSRASTGNTSLDAAIDQIDFSTLDLAMIDDSLELSNIDLDSYLSPDEMGKEPGQLAMLPLESNDVFAGQGMELDDTTFAGPGVPSQPFPSATSNDGRSFDLDQLGQLAQYSGSFHPPQ